MNAYSALCMGYGSVPVRDSLSCRDIVVFDMSVYETSFTASLISMKNIAVSMRNMLKTTRNMM